MVKGKAKKSVKPSLSAEALYGPKVKYPPMPTRTQIEKLAKQQNTRALATPPQADVSLNVPYVHQLWDTPDEFNGHWACGPTSALMVLAYYGLLEARPIQVAKPFLHTSLYGWYINHNFSHKNKPFAEKANTKTGTAAGLYGAVVDRIGDGWGAHWASNRGRGLKPVMDVFLPAVGNKVRIVEKPKQDGSRFLERQAAEETMKACLESGHPMIVSGFFNNKLDHLIVVRGYYKDESGTLQWIVNDPYGFQTDQSFDGNNVVYTFEEMRPKWLSVFSGPFVPDTRALPVTSRSLEGTRAVATAGARGGVITHLLDAALSFALNFLTSKFGASIPKAVLDVALPVVSELMPGVITGGEARLSAATRLKLQARLDDVLRQAGLEGR
jgi:hypothetical protein